MRRQLFLALAMLLLARMEAGSACSYPPGYGPPSDEERFAKASTIFVGHLVRVEEAGLVRADEAGLAGGSQLVPPWPALEGTFRVVEVFKGQPPADGKIRAPRWFTCGAPVLMVGEDIVFFLHEGNFVRSWLEANGAHESLLGKLRDLSKKLQK